MSTKKLQILGSFGNKVYTQPNEPTEAVDGSVWIDVDDTIIGDYSDADTLDGKHASEFAAVDHAHDVATSTAAGFMSSTDKAKLESVYTDVDALIVKVGDTSVSAQIASAIASAIAKKTVQLTTSGWSDNQQTVNVSGVTSSNLVLVSPDPATSNYSAYTKCEICCIAQAANELTFSCKQVPSAAIIVNVAVFL